jgi:hypothetical protein
MQLYFAEGYFNEGCIIYIVAQTAVKVKSSAKVVKVSHSTAAKDLLAKIKEQKRETSSDDSNLLAKNMALKAENISLRSTITAMECMLILILLLLFISLLPIIMYLINDLWL